MPLRLHGCLRCAGALAYDEQHREWSCISCGWAESPPDPLPLARKCLLNAARPSLDRPERVRTKKGR